MGSHESIAAASDDQEGVKPCMSCMAPNLISAEVCVECGQLIDGGSVLTPMGIASADARFMGDVLEGNRAGRRPTLLRLVVVWLVLFPLILMSVVFAVQQVVNPYGLLSWAVFWVAIAVVWFSLKGLYHVTKDFLAPEGPRTP